MKNKLTDVNKFNTSFLSLLFLGAFTSYILAALITKVLPLYLAKAVYFCQELATRTLFQISNIFPNTIMLILSSALILGLLSFIVQVSKTHQLVKRLLLKRVPLSGKVNRILTPLGLKNKVYLVENENLFSFCSGIFSSHIIITTSLVSSLTDRELEAVLLHEKAHLRSLDPVKVLLGKTVSSMFFFLPIFSELNKNIVATNELLADRFVINSQKDTTFLRRALKKILIKSQVTLSTVPAISNPDYLEIRIRRLIDPSIRHHIGISRISVFSSFAFLIMGLFLLQTPVRAFQMDNSMNSSYFVCSAEDACSEKCQDNAKESVVTTPDHLFSSQPLKYGIPFNK